MATGKRLIQNARSGDWARYRYRGQNVERHFKSDRMKGVSKVVNKQLRTYLKKEVREQLIMELNYEKERV